MKKVYIPFVKSSVTVPIVEFLLPGGKKGYAFIDTGSEATLFDIKFVKENKKSFSLQPSRDIVVMHGVSGKTEQQCVNVFTNLSFDGKEKTITVPGMLYDLNHLASVIKPSDESQMPVILLGSDFLSLNMAKLDFENQYLVLNDDLSS